MESVKESKTTLDNSKEKIRSSMKVRPRTFARVGAKIEDYCNSIVRHCLKREYDLQMEQIAKLGQITIPAKIHGRAGTLVRIFDPASCCEKGIHLKDFNSLNEHSSHILYEGYYYGSGGQGLVFIEEKNAARVSLLEKELQNGAIEDIGLEKIPASGNNWLQGFRSFLMSGGWIAAFLLVLVIIGITSAVIK